MYIVHEGIMDPISVAYRIALITSKVGAKGASSRFCSI